MVICRSDQVATDDIGTQHFVVREDFWRLTSCSEYSEERKTQEINFETRGIGMARASSLSINV